MKDIPIPPHLLSQLSNANEPFLPPEGRFRSQLRKVKTKDDPEEIQLIFDLPKQQGLDLDYMANKIYKRSQFGYLLKGLSSILGPDKVRELVKGGKLSADELQVQLEGRCIEIEIEHVNCGQKHAYRNIRSMKPCPDTVAELRKLIGGLPPGMSVNDLPDCFFN